MSFTCICLLLYTCIAYKYLNYISLRNVATIYIYAHHVPLYDLRKETELKIQTQLFIIMQFIGMSE